ncbi:flavoprotein NADH-dependent oxidoreductase [Amanita rubescens]|nr:flavoprotein NADH-dependent oxidoreductase [Amanita rubescens]
MSSTSLLFEPLQLGDITIKNRIAMSALTRDRATKTIPNEVMQEYYVQRSNAGFIVTEGTLITRQGSEWQDAPGIWSDEQVKEWKKIVDAVHAAGSHIYSQIWHLGRVSHPDAPEQKLAGIPVYAPSAISARGGKFRFIPGVPGYVTPTELPDPWVIINQYKQAAINAKAAGFDGVELHGANGYLVAQFLDNTSNKRTDQWGGSIENRARFGLEILKTFKEVYGNNVGLKVSPSCMPLQETLDTFSYFISEADKLGLAYITLARYSEALDPVIDGKRRATPHDVVASYRHLIKNSKVFVNGSVLPEEGAELVKSGKADVVSIGFNYLTHPDFAKRVLYNKPLDNQPNFQHIYGAGNEDLHVGYTDYPAAKYDVVARA